MRLTKRATAPRRTCTKGEERIASLITCPHCGLRPKEEFTIRGDAGPVRPAAGAPAQDFFAYVYLRDNVRGVMHEHWQHTGGCRRWLVVERDTATHAVYSVTDAALFTRARAKIARTSTELPAARPTRKGGRT